MHYYAVSAKTIRNEEKNRFHEFKILEEMSDDDYEALHGAISITKIFSGLSQIRDIVIANGSSLIRYTRGENIKLLHEQHETSKVIIREANKYAFNYASSVKTFVDMAHLVLEARPDDLERFKQFESEMYDDHFEYRFWMRLRNYVVHCQLPYTGFVASLEDGCNVICSRDHLVQWKNWGKVLKEDLLRREDNLDLGSTVDQMSGCINALFVFGISCFTYEIADATRVIGSMYRKYKIQDGFVIGKSEAARDHANMSFTPIPISEVMEMVEVLKLNPNVKLTMEPL